LASVGREVAAAAVARAVLIGRAAVTIIAAAAAVLLVEDRWPVTAVILLVVVVTAAELAVLGRWPGLAAHPVLVIAADTVLVLAVLAVSRGNAAYFCFAAGSGALAGVLLGLRALPVWVVQGAVGFTVVAGVLRRTDPPVEIVTFLVAYPIAGALAGVGAAMATAALANHLEFSAQMVTAAQRSAAASERARLARELHDSVAKTLRGVSLAALALPPLLRRQPAMAESLAETVAAGANAAARQARELLEEMRFDGRNLGAGVRAVCRDWSASTGILVRAVADDTEPPSAVAYEIMRILREALTNVARHSRARSVSVHLGSQPSGLVFEIADDGVGFAVPEDFSGLQSAGHFGLVGMDERARTVGGELRVEARPGAGTRITVQVPVRAPDGPAPSVRGHRRSIGAG
jgi:signal transduction histidine kinase